MIAAFLRDLQLAARLLGKKPGFTAAAVFILALGLGANTTIFNLLHAILIRPLPGIEQPKRLVLIGRTLAGSGFDSLSYPNYLDYRQRGGAFDGVAAYSYGAFNLSAGGENLRVPGAFVSAGYFEVLGVRPALGRAFRPDEEAVRGGGSVAVISHGLWQRLYGSSRGAVGGTVIVNGRAFTVIGIAPATFAGTDIREPPLDIWIPIGSPAQVRPEPASTANRGWNWLSVVARLRSGVRLEQAQAGLTALARGLEQTYPRENRDAGVSVVPYHALGGGDARRDTGRMLVFVLVATVLVLLVACANVAGLLLARASTRGREVAIRLALGAARSRLIRQFLAEGLVLSLVAGPAGLLVSMWTSDLLPRFFPSAEGIPPALDLRPGLALLAYSLGLAILCSLVFSLAPAMLASKPALSSTLRTGQVARSCGGSRFRAALVVTQVALSVVVLAAAGLLVRSLTVLRSIDPRMRPNGLLLATLDPGLSGYDEAAAKRLYHQLLERAARLPGVESVSLARVVPFGNSGMSCGPVLAGVVRDGPGLASDCNLVGPDYFRTLGIGIARGRDFKVSDDERAPRVAVVNETLARKLWPGEDPVGRTIRFAGQPVEWTVIGEARDSRYRSATEPARPFLYLPALEFSSPVFASGLPDFTVHLRTSANATAVPDRFRRLVRELDPTLPLYNVRTMAAQWNNSFWPWRMAATLAGALSLLAMSMATVGLYALVAQQVSRRASEIGLRMALGASSGEILGATILGGMRLAAGGLLVGLLLALAGTRALSGLLYGVTAADPATYAGASLLLLATAFVACWLPARRAAGVDPIVALRYE
jgi:predicted permease